MTMYQLVDGAGGPPTYWVNVEVPPSSGPPAAESSAFPAFFPSVAATI
jgi:hypothetical protein